MREIIFNKDSVRDSIAQAYKKIIEKRYHKYSLLGVGNGGKHIADGLSQYWEFKDILSCEVSNGDACVFG